MPMASLKLKNPNRIEEKLTGQAQNSPTKRKQTPFFRRFVKCTEIFFSLFHLYNIIAAPLVPFEY